MTALIAVGGGDLVVSQQLLAQGTGALTGIVWTEIEGLAVLALLLGADLCALLQTEAESN